MTWGGWYILLAMEMLVTAISLSCKNTFIMCALTFVVVFASAFVYRWWILELKKSIKNDIENA